MPSETRNERKDRYFVEPPPGVTDYDELFAFIWSQGIGNTLSGPNGPGDAWQAPDLAAALNERVSVRTVENWSAGIYVPLPPHMRALLDVITNSRTRKAWQTVLLPAAHKARQRKRPGRNGHRKGEAASPDEAPALPDDHAASADAADLVPQNGQPRPFSRAAWLAAGFIAGGLVVGGAVAVTWGPAGGPPGNAAPIALKTGDTFRDTFADGSGQGPTMIMLPKGTFVMGSLANDPGRQPDEDRRHSVNVDYRLAVSVHEVTWDEYELCVADGACNGYLPDDMGWGRGNRPVVNVNFNDVYAYLHWLNDQMGIAWERPDRYGLLTEAEWEYAALAGIQGTEFPPFATGPQITSDQANFNGLVVDGTQTSGRFIGRPLPVGKYPASRWGLFDMHGNAREWTEDCYRPFHEAMPNDARAYLEKRCINRVTKGGSFLDGAERLRAAARHPILPEYREPDVGFRIARRLDGAWGARPPGAVDAPGDAAKATP